MPWIIGIDEAGYGPNLGPFVMTAAAWQVSETPADLWQLLAAHVRGADDAADDRVLVADSKVVYSPASGLAELERGVLAFTALVGTLNDLVDSLYATTAEELRREFWFTGATPLPHANEAETLADLQEKLADLAAGFQVQGVAVCPTRFNDLLDVHDSKGAVLAESLVFLLGHYLPLGRDGESLHFFVDKHGGRNNYTAMLQHAFADGMVIAQEEGRLRSVYEVIGMPHKVSITFQPRADEEHFCVALASMVSKYARELLMSEFNAFWNTHLPDLKPTAGYPLDAGRFLEEIRPTADKLGLAADCYWRRK